MAFPVDQYTYLHVSDITLREHRSRSPVGVGKSPAVVNKDGSPGINIVVVEHGGAGLVSDALGPAIDNLAMYTGVTEAREQAVFFKL